MYSIGEFAKLIGKSVKTLQRWDREGKFYSKKSPSGRRYYSEEQLLQYKGLKSNEESLNIIYCRVSSASQKNDLKSQKEFINQFTYNAGIHVDEIYEDIGSGLNFKRKNFLKIFDLIENGKIRKIIIAHKDRLVRFGFEWFDRFCKNHGCEIIVINNEKMSPEEEMIKDLISIIHGFSSRIYGLRSYKNKIKEDLKNDKNL